MSLDDDLAAWAAAMRLSDADADAIFQHIVLQGSASRGSASRGSASQRSASQCTVFQGAGAARPTARQSGRRSGQPPTVTAFPATAASAAALSAPAGLTPSWWREYAKGFAARMVTATRPAPVAA